jgi:hypothetical protein
MKYLLNLAFLSLVACQQPSSNNSDTDRFKKTPLAYCQGVYDGVTPFEVLISRYGDGSVVTEPSPGYLAPGEYKGFIDLYVGGGVVIIRNLEQITADKPVTGSCQKY